MTFKEHVLYWRDSVYLAWDQLCDWAFGTFLDFSGTDAPTSEPFILKIYEDKKKEWRWQLKATNGRIICVSSEGYKTKQGVIDALKLAREKITDAVFDKE